MTPKQKVEALLRKTIAAGCPVGEVIAANELAVRLAIQYRIPSNELTWPELPKGYHWEGQLITSDAPKPAPAPKAAPPQPKPTPAQARKLGTKAALAWSLITRANGAHIGDLMSATGWQPHTVRGWVSLQNKACPGLIKTTRSPTGPIYHV